MIDQHESSVPSAAPRGASITNAAGESNEINLLALLTILARRKRLIAKVTGAAMLAGLALALIQTAKYTATTKIMPPQQTQSAASMMMSQLAGAAGAGPLAMMAGGGGLSLKNPDDIYLGLLSSRPIADAVIKRFNLESVYAADDMTGARKALASSTRIETEKMGLLSISVTDKDKKRATEMANAYTEELRNLTKSLAVTEASQRRLFYEDQLKQAKDELVNAEYAFRQVQQSKGLVALDAQAKAMIESLSLLRAQVSAKEVELETLRSYSTDNNPRVQVAERELASMKNEVARAEGQTKSAGVPDLGLGDVPGAGLDYLRAERELKYREALFEMLLKQYDAAKLDEAKDAAIIQVVEPAIEPDRKNPQRRLLILLLSMFVGLFLGSFVALISWSKERAETDPVIAQQIMDLKSALSLRKRAQLEQQ